MVVFVCKLVVIWMVFISCGSMYIFIFKDGGVSWIFVVLVWSSMLLMVIWLVWIIKCMMVIMLYGCK